MPAERSTPFAVPIFAAAACAMAGCPAEPAVKMNGVHLSQRSTRLDYEEFVEIEDESPQEIEYLLAGKDFYVAIAGGEYDRAYDMLSDYAKQDVHPYQFGTSDESDDQRRPDPGRMEELTKEHFVARLQQAEDLFGPPRDVLSLYTFETDPDILAGRGDRLDTMFAIGMMSESVPLEIRKSALRGEIRCRFRPEDLQQVMQETGLTAEELENDDELYPYFNLKSVIVEDGGELKVGYFEFLPPSILD